jgi:hypothetical protein
LITLKGQKNFSWRDAFMFYHLIAEGMACSTAQTIGRLIESGVDISTIFMVVSGAFTGFGGAFALVKKLVGKQTVRVIIGL